jgi:hypothetical protein
MISLPKGRGLGRGVRFGSGFRGAKHVKMSGRSLASTLDPDRGYYGEVPGRLLWGSDGATEMSRR